MYNETYIYRQSKLKLKVICTWMVGSRMIFGQDCSFSRADVFRIARSKVGNSKKSPPALGKAGPIFMRHIWFSGGFA